MKAYQNGTHIFLYLDGMERIQIGDGKTKLESELKDQETGNPLNKNIHLSFDYSFRHSSEVDFNDEEIRITLSGIDYANLGGPAMHITFRDGGFSYDIFEVDSLDDLK